MDKLEKDLTRLTLIVQKMMESQQGGAGAGAAPAAPGGAAALPAPSPLINPATIGNPVNGPLNPIPPGPIPAEARQQGGLRTSPIQQVSAPNAPQVHDR